MTKFYTDYPFEIAFGDKPFEPAPIREVILETYDGNKYCQVTIGKHKQLEVKAGYIYTEHGRFGEVPAVSQEVIDALPKIVRMTDEQIYNEITSLVYDIHGSEPESSSDALDLVVKAKRLCYLLVATRFGRNT